MPNQSLLGLTRARFGSPEFEERKFLSGTGFFKDGNLVLAVMDDGLCIRPGAEDLEAPGVIPFTFAGLPVTGWITVQGASLDEANLARWVDVALQRLDARG